MERPILVVEDDAGIRESLTLVLTEEGYAVTTAGDGLEALEQIGVVRPALILLDLVLPRMDGVAFVAELERRGLHGLIPLLVLTADARAQDKAAQLGAEGYLAKPFELAELLSEVSRILGAADA